MILEKINNSYIYYDDEYSFITKEYYVYCTNLFKEYLDNNTCNLNINFGNTFFNFNNNNKTLNVTTQFEHTLVKSGGRGITNEPKGKIPIEDNFYHVRIADYDRLNKNDIIIEYSLPNIENVSTSGLFNEYSDKLIYISALLYKYEQPVMTGREINCVTLFYNIYEYRRKILLDNIKIRNINSINITNCFTSQNLKYLYSKTKILLNIRQTDHHHTFEELRVLPALLNGVIVISEDVPLRELIPYNEFIIWCKYDSILDTMKEVEKNYEYYWNKIFTGDKLKNILENMGTNNKENIYKIIEKNI